MPVYLYVIAGLAILSWGAMLVLSVLIHAGLKPGTASFYWRDPLAYFSPRTAELYLSEAAMRLFRLRLAVGIAFVALCAIIIGICLFFAR